MNPNGRRVVPAGGCSLRVRVLLCYHQLSLFLIVVTACIYVYICACFRHFLLFFTTNAINGAMIQERRPRALPEPFQSRFRAVSEQIQSSFRAVAI